MKIKKQIYIPTWLAASGAAVTLIILSAVHVRAQSNDYYEVELDQIPTNVLAQYIHPDPWPDADKKSQVFSNCVWALSCALDTNQINQTFEAITNTRFPNASVVFSNFCNQALGVFAETAACLTNTSLGFVSERGNSGFLADITNSSMDAVFECSFWTENGPVRTIRMGTLSNGGNITTTAEFHQNGKLRLFQASTMAGADFGGVCEGLLQFDVAGNFNRFSLNVGDMNQYESWWFRPDSAKTKIEARHKKVSPQ